MAIGGDDDDDAEDILKPYLGDEAEHSFAPEQSPTIVPQIATLDISSGLSGCSSFQLKLNVNAGPGCGGIAWPAGLVLANYLTTKMSLQGLDIIELGSGTGLVGIVGGLMHARNVWITDQIQLLDLMRSNVELNNLGDNVRVEELDWARPLPSTIPPSPDLVLAADCVYFEPAFPLLVHTLCTLTSAEKTQVLFCYKKRRKADKNFFVLLKKEFRWEEVMDDPRREEYRREGIFLYRLFRKAMSA